MAKYVNFNGSDLKMPNVGGDSNSFMSKIKTAGSSLNMTTMVIISALILFAILAGVYCYYTFKPSTAYKPNNEHITTGTGSKSAELLFFHVDWCPHCKAAKPIWNDLKSEYQNKTINGYQVIFTEINCSEETAEVEKLMNQYNVEGYPTIKLLKDGQIIEYDAKPSRDTLTQFLNTVL